jgi:hypothetical protein
MIALVYVYANPFVWTNLRGVIPDMTRRAVDLQADLGMAIGNGTDIAIEAAGMVLMGSSLSGVVTAIDVSRAIHRRIWMNFGWAFVYNLVSHDEHIKYETCLLAI